MSKYFFLPSIVFSLFYCFHPCYSQESGLSFADRLSNWKERANAHEGEVALLLSQPPLPRSNFDLPEPPKTLTPTGSFPPEPQVDLPFIPVPDYIEEEPSDSDETDFISEPPVSTDADSESNQSLVSQQGVDDAYAELYDTDRPMKHEGFYLGLISGILFPSDVLLREPSGIKSSPNNSSYDADMVTCLVYKSVMILVLSRWRQIIHTIILMLTENPVHLKLAYTISLAG